MMKNDYKFFVKKESCRLCNSKNLKLCIKMPVCPPVDNYRDVDSPLLNIPSFPMDLNLCSDCGNTQLSHVVDPNILYSNYIYDSSSSSDLNKHFHQYYKEITKIKNYSSSMKILDIGSNDGLFLDNFKNHKVKIGIDPAKIKNKCKDVYEIKDYFCKEVCNKILSKFEKINLITANNVFSHIDNLEEFISNLKMILSDDGFFIFEVSYFPDLIKNKVLDYIYHEHLNYFSLNPLKTFFEKRKLFINYVQKIKTKGGSIRCFVSKKKYNANITSDYPITLLEKENVALGKQISDTVKYYEFVKKKINKTLTELKKNNYKIYFYGASATTTVFFHLNNLFDLVDCIIDDNVKRQDKLMPGTIIKVKSKKVIKKSSKKVVVIGAWRFADIIMKNNSDVFNNCKVIIPLPKYEEINL